MPNYQNGKIYSIRSPNTEKYYIGSTTQKLYNRITGHRRKLDGCSSREIINSGGAYIELIELYPCNSKEELCKREGEIMRQFKNNIVNIQVIGRTHKEYMKEYGKIRDLIKINCECGLITDLKHKSRHEKTKKHLEKLKNV